LLADLVARAVVRGDRGAALGPARVGQTVRQPRRGPIRGARWIDDARRELRSGGDDDRDGHERCKDTGPSVHGWRLPYAASRPEALPRLASFFAASFCVLFSRSFASRPFTASLPPVEPPNERAPTVLSLFAETFTVHAESGVSKK